MGFKRVIAVQDDSSHWYVIPVELEDEFNDLENSIVDASTEEGGDNYYKLTDEFNNKFGEYATGGDLNLTELYIKDAE